MLGLERISSNSILWTAHVSVKSEDDAATAVARAELNAMTSKLKEFTSNGAAVEFVYLNYADSSQDPLGSYGPKNVAFMKDVAKHYDPQGWWQQRVPGGFKLSRVAV
jgi:V8-like Glu-specific endopeptidase